MYEINLIDITQDLERIRKFLDVQQIEITKEINRSKSYLSKIIARNEKLIQADATKYLFFLLRTARRKILSIDPYKRKGLQSCICELMDMVTLLKAPLDLQPPYTRMKPEAPNFILKGNFEEKFWDGLHMANNYNFIGAIKGGPSTGKTSALLWATHIALDSGVNNVLAINMNHVFDEAKIYFQRSGDLKLDKFPGYLQKIFYKSLAIQVIDALRLGHDDFKDETLDFLDRLNNEDNPEQVMRDALKILLFNTSAILVVDGIDIICLQFLALNEKLRNKIAGKNKLSESEVSQLISKLAEPILLEIRQLVQHDSQTPTSRSFSVLISFTFERLWPEIEESSLFFEARKILIRPYLREEAVRNLSEIFNLKNISYPSLKEFIGAHPFLVHVLFYEYSRYLMQGPSKIDPPEEWLNILLNPISNSKNTGAAALHIRKIAEAYKRYGDTILSIANNIKIMDSYCPNFGGVKESLFINNNKLIPNMFKFKNNQESSEMLIEAGIFSDDISNTPEEYSPFSSRFHAKCFYDKDYIKNLGRFANP